MSLYHELESPVKSVQQILHLHSNISLNEQLYIKVGLNTADKLYRVCVYKQNEYKLQYTLYEVANSK